MSLLGSILKIAGIGLAPVSGGASLALTGAGTAMDKIGKATSAAGDVGTVLGGQQSGKNNARVAQSQINLGNDRNAIDLYEAQQQAQNQAAQQDLQRQQFGTQNRSATAKQALIGALLGGGVTPTSLSGGKASGGLLASLNGNPDALAAMKLLASQGSQAQSTPLAFTGGQMLQAPTLTPMPKIDEGGGTMGTLTKIAQLAGAVSPYLKKHDYMGDEDGGQ